MKKLLFSWLLSVMFFTAINAQYGSERTGYDGDYFSLEGAIEIFKESRSIRDFEKRINREDAWVNNLDLDYDGRTDYVRVEHRRQGSFHAIVLQVHVGRRDVQDIAVIEIEKTGRREAVLQIIGDPDMYGEEVIVEPYNDDGYTSGRGNYNSDYDYNRGFVNVYHWRAVQDLFDPYYQVYVSPYRWNYYPTYWSPWYQNSWTVFHPHRVRYHRHYHVVYVHRVIRVHHFYKPHRLHSRHIAQRTHKVRQARGRSGGHQGKVNRNTTHRDLASINRKVQSPRLVNTPRRTANDRVRDQRTTPRATPPTTARNSQSPRRTGQIMGDTPRRNSNGRTYSDKTPSRSGSSAPQVKRGSTQVERGNNNRSYEPRKTPSRTQSSNSRVKQEQKQRSTTKKGISGRSYEKRSTPSRAPSTATKRQQRSSAQSSRPSTRSQENARSSQKRHSAPTRSASASRSSSKQGSSARKAPSSNRSSKKAPSRNGGKRGGRGN